MKKILITVILSLMVSMLVIVPVSAETTKVAIQGQIIAMDSETLTVLTNESETFLVIVPDGFDLNTVQVGDSVLVQGNLDEDDGVIEADTISLVGEYVALAGEVVGIDGETLTILTVEGETFVVIVPDGFDISTIQLGDLVLVKGFVVENGLIKADSIVLVNEVIVITGEVVAIDGETLTVHTTEGETFLVIVPDDFDISTLQVGDLVLVKGIVVEEGVIEAYSITLLGEDDEDDGGKAGNSAYCAEGKKDNPHPMALKLSERYGVTVEWVMGYFCDGYGMGAIMLALKTGEIEGFDIDPDALLAARAEGQGWGQIWKELGLIGNQKDGESPSGHLKKPDHAGKPDDNGKPDDKGKPDHAGGPKDKKDKDKD